MLTVAQLDGSFRTTRSRSPLKSATRTFGLGRAQRLYPIEICAFCFALNHFHLWARVEDSERLSRYFNSKLAREVARSTGWRDKVFSRRYQAILVSDEEEAQVGRLVYVLSHGSKENLVARPQDWPGVHCVTALILQKKTRSTPKTTIETCRRRLAEYDLYK